MTAPIPRAKFPERNKAKKSHPRPAPDPQLSQYKATNILPPGPSDSNGYKVYTNIANNDDSAHYILNPDTQFARPWIASPGVGSSGIAFVFPLGVEGFSLTSSPDLGIHKYIGDNDIDIDVVYPDEFHITLTGIFPGDTAPEQYRALRKVLTHQQTTRGKVLSLPIIAERILYVSVVNYSFSHDENDRTQTISYSLEFIQQGTGGKLRHRDLTPARKNPTTKRSKRGKSTKRKVVKGGGTVRKNAAQVYDDPSMQYQVLRENLNQLSTDLGLMPHQLAYMQLPPGTVLDY